MCQSLIVCLSPQKLFEARYSPSFLNQALLWKTMKLRPLKTLQCCLR